MVWVVFLFVSGNFEFGFIKIDYDDFWGLVGVYDFIDEGWLVFIFFEI